MKNFGSLLVIAIWIAIVISIAVVCRRHFPKAKELSRKIVHIGIGPVIPMAWWLEISSKIAIPAAMVITIGLLINQHLQLLPAIEDVQRKSYGTSAYALSITILLILFWPEKAPAVSSGVLVMSFGDGLAGLIGRQFKSPSWTIFNQRKSIIGTLTMLLISTIVLLLMTIISQDVLNPLRIFEVAFLAATLEQIGPWGIDNITVPIGVGCAWSWMIAI